MSTERMIRRRWSRAAWPALGLLLAGFGIACFLEPAEIGGFRPSASRLFAAEEEAPPAKGGDSADEPKSDDSDKRAESPPPQAKPGTVNRAQFALRSQARRRPTGGSSDKSLLQLDCYYDVGSPQGGLLVRELYRQALLIAARDELHMRTRDRVLRENFANDPNEPNRPLNVVVEPLGNLRMKVRVERWDGQKDVVLKEWTTILPPDSQVVLVTKSAEDWSRTRFVELLKGLDFAAEERQAAGEASIPEEIQEEGRQLNVVSQYAVVRKLHAEIAEHGESPQLLSGLARSYALLGSLTDYFWSTSPKAFEARALLYAERGLQADPKNAEALRTRAFVRALVGLHGDALADLKQAEAQDPDGEASREIAAIAAYCKWDLDALEELAEDQSVRALALYLRMRAIDAFSTEEERDAAARQVTAVCPDCMRACEVIARDASLRVSRMICDGQHGAFAGAVYGRIASNKIVPENVAKKIPAAPKNADEQQPRIEIPRRVTLIKQLRRAGTPGNDTGEPSLSVLASLIQDTSFVHALRTMELSATKLGYDNDATLNVLKPLFTDHPFALFIEEYRWKKTQSLTGKMLVATPYVEFDTFAAPCIEVTGNNFAPAQQPLLQEIQSHRDQIFRDLIQVPLATGAPRGFGDRVWQAWTNRGATPVSLWLRKLQAVSPHSAALVGLVITYDWDQTKQRAAEWEQQYDDHASILGALADAYIRNDQPDDAERCLKRVIELHPHQSEYRRLAELYQQEGNTELWLSTLKDSLQAQAQGLETAQTCVEITQHLMREGKAKEARPFAERAGQSYSSWGLTCAAECCDALGDWDAANEYYRRNSQRYEGTDIIWYRWCRRTGRGDLDASRKLVAPRLDALKDVKGAGARLQYGIYCESEGRKAEALKAYSDVFAGTHYPFAGMLAFLVADELEQTEKRDELLTEIVCQSGAFAEHYLPFALAFRKTLSNHDEEFITRARADWYVSQRMNSGDTTVAMYFVGKFLLNRGRRELAIEYLRQAASSPVEVSYGDVRILAGVGLSTVDVETPPLRAVEFPEAMATGIDDVVQAVGPQRDDERTQLLESARTQAPELTIAWIQSAVAAAAQKKFDDSDAFYRQALELVDGEPTLLAFQGKLHAAHKRRREAIADYEAVLKKDAQHPVALLQLAVILAISADDDIRDGKRSVELAERCMQSGLIAKWSAYEVLAVAHAEAGQFAEAIKDCNQALEHAPDARKPAIQYYINEFKQNRPLREQPPQEQEKEDDSE